MDHDQYYASAKGRHSGGRTRKFNLSKFVKRIALFL